MGRCAHALQILLLVGVACLHAPLAAGGTTSDVVVLTDDNFDALTSDGKWLIKIYAPRCPHCVRLEPTWESIASELKGRVHVGKIDGTVEKVLRQRFDVKGYPSIYLLDRGNAWAFEQARSKNALMDFALQSHSTSSRLPFVKSPNSSLGRAMGLVLSVPAKGKKFYHFLHGTLGVSDVAIVMGVVLTPVSVGVVFICVLDAVYSRRAAGHFHIE